MGMMIRICLLITIVNSGIAGLQASPPRQAVKNRTIHGEGYLEPLPHVGESFTNVFSRTIAFQVPSMDDFVSRVSGTGVYVTKEIAGGRLVFDGTFLYDGRPESEGKVELRDHGSITCWNGQCSRAADASGLLYNAALWGEPKIGLRKGLSWSVDLAEPWELGPAGRQRVTVISVNSAEHVITLKREGSGSGFFANDKKQVKLTRNGKTYTVDLTPGPARWSGYTTFRAGIVLSDELVVERPVMFSNVELGTLAGTEREYILLNLAPNGSV